MACHDRGMRHLLLWMARHRLLKRWLPRIWCVRRAVRRFMPDETVEEALDAAEFFRPYGIGILFVKPRRSPITITACWQ